MKTETASIRQTVALFYVPVVLDQEQTVFLPCKHQEIIRKIYNHTGLSRVIKKADPENMNLAPHSHIHSHVLPETASAFLRGKVLGVDFIDELKLQIRDLKLRGAELIVKLSAQLERRKKELEITQQIQESFLPHTIPVIKKYDLAASSIPAQEVGGDFYDFIPITGKQTG